MNRGKSQSLSHILVFAFMLAFVIQALWSVRDVRAQEKPESSLDLCIKNLKAIALAMKKYAKDNNGYPEKLEQLTPKYLPTVLTCPVAKKAYAYKLTSTMDFVVSCPPGAIWHHDEGIQEAGYPRYVSPSPGKPGGIIKGK